MLRQLADQLAARLLQTGGQGQARAAVIVSATSHSGATVAAPGSAPPAPGSPAAGPQAQQPCFRGDGRASWAFHP